MWWSLKDRGRWRLVNMDNVVFIEETTEPTRCILHLVNGKVLEFDSTLGLFKDLVIGYPNAVGVGPEHGDAIAVLTRDSHQDEKHQQANARLIAPAPALLTALRDMLKLEQDRASGQLGREEYERRMERARAVAALAVAEERTP